MTIQLSVEVGDRVQFKSEGLPDYRIHTGTGEDLSWQEHFGGQPGLVDCVDIPNLLVRVRGRHTDGTDFTVWIEPGYLDVTQRGMDFGGPTVGT